MSIFLSLDGNLKYLNPNIFHRNAGKNNTKAIALAASYSSQSAFQNSRKIEMFLSKLTIEEKQKLVTILQSEMKGLFILILNHC